jgi:hypothetical protein
MESCRNQGLQNIMRFDTIETSRENLTLNLCNLSQLVLELDELIDDELIASPLSFAAATNYKSSILPSLKTLGSTLLQWHRT